MNFSELCISRLKTLKNGSAFESYGETYFSIERIMSLPNFLKNNQLMDDLIITPYYVSNGKRMELYEFRLSIRIVQSVQGKEHFFLDETGKKSIELIPPSVLTQLDNTFFEVLGGDFDSFLKSLERYIEYMRVIEPEIKSREKKLKPDSVVEDGIYYEIK